MSYLILWLRKNDHLFLPHYIAMKTIQASFILLLSFVLLLPQGCKQDEIQPTQSCSTSSPAPHPKAASYQKVLNDYVRKGLPGISLLIRDEDGTWYGAAGMADIDKGIAMQPCHVSKAASVTKIFIGALIMKLVEEGKMELDAPLSKYVAAKHLDKVANAKQVTLRQLLNHTSGIPDVIVQNSFYLAVLNNPGRFWTPEDLLKYVKGLDPVFELGTQLEYSNTNLLYAAMAIEGATGQDHAQLLREKILDPLNLEDTYYHWHEGLSNFVAQGYFDLYNNNTLVNIANLNTGSGNGYGGIYSTVFDLQRFIEALLRDKTLLQAQTLQEMTRMSAEDLPELEAYGVTIRKDFLDRPTNQYALGHRGRDLGYTADLFYFPNQDITMAYLINYGTDAESDLKTVFLDFRKAIVDEMMKE